MVCTFFGHSDCYDLDSKKLRDAIEDMIHRDVVIFYVGNQGHFDRMVYSCLKQLRQVYPHICISVVLAYPPVQKTDYLDTEDTIYPEIEKGLSRFAIPRRNAWMIDQSTHCICYINHTWGKAYDFACLAKGRHLDVVNLGTAKL